MLPEAGEASGSIFKPEVTVFHYIRTDPKPANNIFIFFPAVNWLNYKCASRQCLRQCVVYMRAHVSSTCCVMNGHL